MPSDPAFSALMRRVRAGDGEAATELVRRFEPNVRRVIRLRLTDPRLGRLFDSVDVCQSVLANFFVRVAAGQFDLQTPEQLVRLLATMARNKLLNLVEKHQADRRDARRVEASDEAIAALADEQETPSTIVAGRELLEHARRLMSDEERHLAEQRALGREWADIAAEVESSPEALRKKLSRAVDRVVAQLGLEDLSP
jgi:RNA polymerase sigma-70 factor (ECF subfamily)